MPLKCLRNGVELLAFSVTDDLAWELLRADNVKDSCLRMCCCPSKAVLKTSRLGTRYFAHSRRGNCTTMPESAEHLLAKIAIAAGIARARWTAGVEHEGCAPSGDRWTADVLATSSKKGVVAFEVQWSRQTAQETRDRHAIYAASGVRAMWLFRQHDFPVEKALPAFRLAFDEESKTFDAMLPSPEHSPAFSSRGRDAPRFWQSRVELSRFVEGALTGRLRFAPALNRVLPLDVVSAPVSCWKCGKDTNVVIELIFAAGRVLPSCPDIRASIYDFDPPFPGGVERLAKLLPPDALKRHGIGALKRRYSATMGGSYISNGCVHCDALQGKFYDYRAASDAKALFCVNVTLEEEWASALPHSRRAIYRWWFDEMDTAAQAPSTAP